MLAHGSGNVLHAHYTQYRDGPGTGVARIARTIEVADHDSLLDWRAGLRGIFSFQVLPVVTFSFPGIDQASNRRLTAEVARLQRQCGCTHAGLAMTLTVLGIVISIMGNTGRWGSLDWMDGLVYLVFVLAAGAVGKLAGLLWSRRQLVLLADDIERAVKWPGPETT